MGAKEEVITDLLKRIIEYDEDRDPGGHKLAGLMKEVSQITGTIDIIANEKWIYEGIAKYFPQEEVPSNKESAEYHSGGSALDKLIERSQGDRELEILRRFREAWKEAEYKRRRYLHKT